MLDQNRQLRRWQHVGLSSADPLSTFFVAVSIYQPVHANTSPSFGKEKRLRGRRRSLIKLSAVSFNASFLICCLNQSGDRINRCVLISILFIGLPVMHGMYFFGKYQKIVYYLPKKNKNTKTYLNPKEEQPIRWNT